MYSASCSRRCSPAALKSVRSKMRHRCQYILEVLTRIVDPVLCHQHAVPTEVGHALTRHPEVLDDTGDGLQGLVRREIQCCAAGIAVEDHVEVLVGGDPGQQSVGDRVTACLAGIAVADPGGELLEGDVRER